jgi:CDP-6-deoxy-D-xylo-4-hexulose-3-dehydrase
MSSTSFYPLASTTWDAKETDAILDVVKSGNHTLGANVRDFEREFADFFGSRYAVMSNSGSSANLLALAAVRYSADNDLRNRDEIIVPAVSWSTTYYPINQMGYKLKFVDIDLGTLNSSSVAIEAAVTSRTAGIFAVSLLGNPADLLSYRDIADRHQLFLIEDNCESMGASIGDKFTGTFGRVGTFSSYYSHHISTIEGGVSVTDDLVLYEHMVSLRAHGWLRNLPTSNSVANKVGDNFEDSFKFALPGWNLRPIEIEGAIGLQQLKKFKGILSARKKNALIFQELMNDLGNFVIQEERHGESSWFGFSLVLQGKLEGHRKALISLLDEQGIECRPIVAGNFTRNPVMKHLNHSPIHSLRVADLIHENGVFVGNHHFDLTEQLHVLVSLLRRFDSQY